MNVLIPHRILGRALGLSLADTASAQSEVFDESGDEAADHFGVATACAGDLNNDGHPVLVIRAPEEANIFVPVAGASNFSLSDAQSIQFCP